MSLVETFSDVDDFCLFFEPRWQKFLLKSGLRQRRRKGNLSLSEIMTIMIHFHQSGYRTFKGYYLKHVQKYLSEDFPKLVKLRCLECSSCEIFFNWSLIVSIIERLRRRSLSIKGIRRFFIFFRTPVIS